MKESPLPLKEQKSDNETIAEFMGRDWRNEFKWIDNEDKPGKQIEIPADVCDLLYDRSWNWLMPVVEKIESLGFKTTLIAHSASDHSFHINEKTFAAAFAFGRTKIEAVYKAVVEFVKAYNSQKP